MQRNAPSRVAPAALGALQHNTDRIRNICILAHVDHGKTTLSDSLVSANGIISEKLAGKLRFLDSTEEEQIRGITMKSSAISLLFQNEPTANAANADATPYLINLVDSPGHVDFSFDVSTAVRLCDGALVLIDAVEGVCAQTIAVLRQAWQEGIRPCLVINKVDRLIFELQLTTEESYQLLHRIVEQANAVLSSLIRAEVMAKHEHEDGDTIDEAACVAETAAMEHEMLLSPCNGNVLFASATDGWAFNVGFFAQLYAKKLEVPFRAMRQALWGEYYYNSKTKKIVTKPPSATSQPLFCSLILDYIWNTYTTLGRPIESDADAEEMRTLTKQLRVAKLVSDRDLRHPERKNAIQAVMRKWLPLAPTVLKMVTRALPSPVAAQARRAQKLCQVSSLELEGHAPQMQVYRSLQDCATAAEAPLVVYICKMVSVEANLLSNAYELGLTRDDDVYVAVGRVYSGVLRIGQPVHVLDPKFQGFQGEESHAMDISAIKHVSRLEQGMLRPYMMMGRELNALDEVPAGNIVGIVGLQDHILKTATLSSTLTCPSLTKMPYQAKPIVRVAVEPEDPRNFAALEAGLQRLYRSDPTVEVQVQQTGEHVIVALGELHLERCIKDLKERFAKVAVRVSEPLVGFRESIVPGTISPTQESVVFKDILQHNDAASAATGDPKVAYTTTADGTVLLKVRALPLPAGLAQLLEENTDALRHLVGANKLSEDTDDAVETATAIEATADQTEEFKRQFDTLLRASGDAFWKHVTLDQVWACGPRRVGPNMLINAVLGYRLTTGSLFNGEQPLRSTASERDEQLSKLENSIATGFQLATAAGPMCDEPVWGVAYVLEDFEFRAKEESVDGDAEEDNRFGPLTGQVISTMRSACRVAVVKQPLRLVEAVYLCTVQCLADQLGKLYSVISKRRGTIFSEELSDGTALFTIKAHLPVVESFGFASDVLTQTSGAASNPQLVFAHWSVIETDPYFQPQTEEEREDYGERVYEHNYVRKYIEAVRKRKGLARDEKVVVHAEKQRTLARKR